MFPFAPLPLILEATFIPFRNVIISDGLVLPYNILIGSNMKKQFKDIYMTAKKNGTLIKSLQQNGSIKLHEGAETLIQKWKKFDKLTAGTVPYDGDLRFLLPYSPLPRAFFQG